MPDIRETAVAGLFYPDNPRLLQQQLDGYLKSAQAGETRPKALVVPHAGYVYSGPVAASAYRQLESGRSRIRRVILLGPAHRVGFSGLAVSSARYFNSPLGLVAIDEQARDDILTLPQVQVLDEAHREEHSLEVQLPFLQTVLGNDFLLLPLVVGDADSETVAEVLDRLWGGDETLILVSSDLSHYEDYDTAQRLDRATSQAITRLDPSAIDGHMACGYHPLGGLLLAARKHHLEGHLLDLRNSGDTAGSRDRVVGYGAYAFY